MRQWKSSASEVSSERSVGMIFTKQGDAIKMTASIQDRLPEDQDGASLRDDADYLSTE